MKILVNAITAKMGGFKTLIISFIENISEDDGNEYYFLCPKGVIDKSLLYKKNINIIETDKGNINHIRRFLWYQFSLPKYLKKNKFDYMINLTNYGPIKPKCNQILLLHNSKHVSEQIKESLSIQNKIKLFVQDIVFKCSLIGTETLVVQTNYMKEGVMRKFKFPADKIKIIPSAPCEIVDDDFDEEIELQIKNFIGSESNIICNITLYAAHKNLELLLYAIKYIKDNDLCKLKLIITIDKYGGNDQENLINMISELNIQDYVLSIGNIKHNNIKKLLDLSKVFIFPSYAESFGIPFVEAMKCGKPIVAADLGFAHDVCGDSAVYFKYNDEKELAKSISDILSNERLLHEKTENAIRRSFLFNEKDIVKQYVELLV
ncbi:MAG: glycosyltransferase [Romboutsia timonensis]|uniref:glycosyltransferase n=1 Tax=Romboutsia timonensis TaxID=1776391 RepID=UPI002A74B55A|nr:glycosyltransferase [Romboutsia timonensis]MDY2882871.1 glycosyltransferase [Romboutsia timonensis]